MGSLISSLYTGASGIFVNQTAIQVTGNNIANVNTAGYSRQSADISSASPLEQGGLLYGSGSTVATIDRAGDAFITKQLVAQSATYGEYEAASTPLADIEQILAIDDSSLAGAIDGFFDAWEELSTNPSGTTERQQVLQAAEDLAAHCRQIDQQLVEVVDGINTTIETAIPSLNDQLEQIADLNNRIMQAEQNGGEANTLRDQRDLLVQQVSETCGAATYADDNGMVCLQLGTGLPLVTGKVAATFSVTQIDGRAQITLTSGNANFSLDANTFEGKLKGLLATRDQAIPELQDAIDQLTYEIVSAVNTLHTTGVDKNGAAGTDLFTLVAPTDPSADPWDGAAASIAVAFDDPALVAAGTTGATGDNSLCLSLAGLRETPAINGATYTEEYARIAAKAGLLVNSNEQKLGASTDLLDAINVKRDSVAGVSTDEEMVRLIQYQAGYEAASNYLSIVKEMLDTLLNM